MNFSCNAHRGKDKRRHGLGAEPRRATGRVLAASLAALGLSLLLAVPANAGLKKFRVGVMDALANPVTEVPRMGDLNVGSARLLFLWHRIETDGGAVGRCDNTFDWGYYDELVTQTSLENVRLLPVLIGSPPYAATPKPSNAPRSRSKAIGDWKCFVRAVVGRYGRGGDFVRGKPGVDPITEWQVWNEPNVKAFAARRKPAPKEYARFLKLTRPQIRSQDRKAKIILAGMPEFLIKGMDARPYLKRFYKVKRVERNFDALAIHPYARSYKGVKGAMVRLRRLLKQVGDRRRPVWITETGFSTDGPKGHFLVKSERAQGRQLTKLFKMLRSNRKRFKLGTVHWFRWRDAQPYGETNYQFDYAGLYKRNGEQKPSCRSFARFTRGHCRDIDVQAPGTWSTAASARESDLLDAGAEEVVPSPRK